MKSIEELEAHVRELEAENVRLINAYPERCTPAERAVLDAMAQVPLDSIKILSDYHRANCGADKLECSWNAVGDAELARREAK